MKIPEYTRRRLASSVVGTPGIDTSGERMAQTVAQVSSGVADLAGQVAVERKRAMDRAVGFDNALNYEAQLEAAHAKHAQEYAAFDGDPIQRAEIFRQKAAELRDGLGRSIQSEGARQEFMERATTALGSKFRDELKLASENQVAIGAERVVSANNRLATSVYGLFANPEVDYGQKMQTLRAADARRRENVQNSIALLGAKESLKLDQSSRQSLIKGAVLGFLDKDPVNGLKFLRESEVREVLGAEEHTQMVDKMKKRATDFKELIKERQYERVAETNSEDIDKFMRGEHTLGTIQNIADDTTRKFLTNAYLDAKQLTAEEIATRESELQLEWEDFFVRDKNGNLTEDIKKDKSILDVVELQHKYMRHFDVSRGTGRLERAAKSYPDMLRQAIKNQQPSPALKALIMFLNGVSWPFGAASVAGQAAKKLKEPLAARERAAMTDMFLAKLAAVDPENVDQVKDAVRTTISAYQFYKRPEETQFVLGETYVFGGRPYKAVRRADGSIGFDDGK